MVKKKAIKKTIVKKSTKTKKAIKSKPVVVSKKPKVIPKSKVITQKPIAIPKKPFFVFGKRIKPQNTFSKFDLHIHSKFSRDAVNEPATIIRKVKEAGLRGFAITDHNTIRAWPELARLSKESDIVFIPGQEIDVTLNGKKLGHILALFCYDKIVSTEILDVVDEAKSQSALLSFPHPFDTIRYFKGFNYLSSNGSISKFVPAIETFNSRVMISRANDLAKDFAHKHGLLQTAGSDAHMPYEIGQGYVIAKAQTETELLREIKLGRVVTSGELSGLGPRLHTLGAYLNIVRDRHFR